MGHDNIDKHIKGKLEQRVIQPSSEAWAKLSSMLDEENQQSNKKGYYKYAVAASIVFLLGFFFTSQYNNREAIIIDDVVIAVEKNDMSSSVNKVVVRSVNSQMKKDVKIERPKEERGNEVVRESAIYGYAESFNVKEELRQEEEIRAIKEKVNQYLAQLEKSKQGKLNKETDAYDLDAEINALLAEASNNLPEEKRSDNLPIFQLDEETDMLLATAFQELNFNPEEDTVDESLKNKLFKQLEKGYFKSKMLLAERSQLTRP
ncbi:MAG: hypothetical protein HRT69_01090 [Flavobacteriaceae bacterium]|nr:hypothetical protein [Flavobacteriaceae bacterium]